MVGETSANSTVHTFLLTMTAEGRGPSPTDGVYGEEPMCAFHRAF